MKLFADRLHRMMMTGDYRPYKSQEAACFAVLCAMARLDWDWYDVRGVIIPDGKPMYPLWQGYLWPHSVLQNVFMVPDNKRQATYQERERAIKFLAGEYTRALAFVRPEQVQLDALAQLEFPGWGKVDLSRLAGYRAHLLAAQEFGPKEYGLGQVSFAVAAGFGSAATAVSVQAWLETVGLVKCRARGNYYRGRVSTYQLRLPTLSMSEMNSSIQVFYVLEEDEVFNEEENLGPNCSFHSSLNYPDQGVLGLRALPFSHARIKLIPRHPVWDRLGRLAGFLTERLWYDEPVFLPAWLDRVAREQLQPLGLVKPTLTGGWIRIEQDLDMLLAGMK